MALKLYQKANRTLAIFAGVQCLGVSFYGLIGIFSWLYKVHLGTVVFSWSIVLTLITMCAIMGAIGYAILRTGLEKANIK